MSEEGLFSPADYAQACFEQNGEELDNDTKEVFASYKWEYGEYVVSCEYAPENEDTRVFYIVTLQGNEFMRCKYETAITSFFEILEQLNALENRCNELEEDLSKKQSGGLLGKLFK
ncbi:MAG: hypothetical protein ABW127_19445 [Candidatus Thiodiazotropha endolucinida]